MDGEVILQVKVRRGDVYDAVRNLLLNEFKVIPGDLLAAAEKKVDARLTEVVERIWNRWGWEEKTRKVVEIAIQKKIDAVGYMIEQMVREEVAKAVRHGLVEDVLQKFISQLGKGDTKS